MSAYGVISEVPVLRFNGLQERAANAAKGAAFGGVLGGVLPVLGATAKTVAAPIVSNIKARVNPQGYAEGQVARAIQESGRTPTDISLDTIQAHNNGQGEFTVADAMGNPGQRMLSTVARAPGEGRTAVVDAMATRDAGAPRRIANTLAEGFDAPQTAARKIANAPEASPARAISTYRGGMALKRRGSADLATVGRRCAKASPARSRSFWSCEPEFSRRATRHRSCGFRPRDRNLQRCTGIRIGLPISRSTIAAHRDTIRVDNNSTLGGARFSFLLPADGTGYAALALIS